MKYKKQVLCGLMLCFCLCMTGCGKLYVMTDDEENQVVLYAAKMVSKYNRAQDTGYSYVSDEHKDKQKDTDVGQSDDASVDETQQEKTQMTLSDVIGISGISFSYQGYDISSSYESTDVAIPDAGEGYSYLILHVQVANTTDQAVTVDLINQPVTYQVKINDGTAIDVRSHWTEIEKYLEDQKVAQELIGELRDFHMRYEVEDQVKERVEKPDMAVMNWMWIFRDLRKTRLRFS